MTAHTSWQLYTGPSPCSACWRDAIAHNLPKPPPAAWTRLERGIRVYACPAHLGGAA